MRAINPTCLFRMAVLGLSAMALFATGPALAKKATLPPHEYGPEPDWERYKQLGEEAIRNILIDPDSARFDWPYGYLKRGWGPIRGRRIPGYVTCGLVNSKNSYGGYTGRAFFVVVIDYDRVTYLEVGKGGGDILGDGCMASAFPPPPPVAAAIARDEAAMVESKRSSVPLSIFGIDMTVMPDGAYVSGVTFDGSGDTAGVKPGMVIAKINGITLKGMSTDAIAQLLPTLGTSAMFEMIGGTVIAVKQP